MALWNAYSYETGDLFGSFVSSTENGAKQQAMAKFSYVPSYDWNIQLVTSKSINKSKSMPRKKTKRRKLVPVRVVHVMHAPKKRKKRRKTKKFLGIF